MSILIATVGAVGLLRGAQPASNSSMMIMRRRSGLMGVVVLIGVLLVSRWRLLDPSTLKTGHFPSRYRALVLTPLPGNMSTDVPRVPQAGA